MAIAIKAVRTFVSGAQPNYKEIKRNTPSYS
jgi:hypothetical protein